VVGQRLHRQPAAARQRVIGRLHEDQRVGGEGFGTRRQILRRPAYDGQVGFAGLHQRHQLFAIAGTDASGR